MSKNARRLGHEARSFNLQSWRNSENMINHSAGLLDESSGEEFLNLLHYFHEVIHLCLGVVEIEARAGGRFNA